jgi:hypothetical protein
MVSSRNSHLDAFTVGVAILICIEILTRIYLYIDCKDLWLDEASLAMGIYERDWDSILRGIINGQSTPFLFGVLAKFCSRLTSYDEHVLYFLPLICGCGTVLVICMACRKIAGNAYAFICLAVFGVCYTPLYYSIEFKQYSVELLASCLIIYRYIVDVYIRNKSDITWGHIALFSVSLLFSSTSIFISMAFFFAIFIDRMLANMNICKCLAQCKKDIWKISFFILFVVCYYILYLRNGGNSFMYTYWEKYFIPINPLEWFEYIKTVAFKVFNALVSQGGGFWYEKYHSAIFFIAFFGGAYFLWNDHRKLFYLIASIVAIVWIANFKIYPPGHGGAPHGGRLLLFILPTIILADGYLCLVIANALLKKVSPRKNFLATVLLTSFFILPVMAMNGRYVVKNIYMQQTHELVKEINHNYGAGTDLYVYGSSVAAYKYYQLLEGSTDKPYTVLKRSEEFEAPIDALVKNGRKEFVIFSHYWGIGEKMIAYLENRLKETGRPYTLIERQGAKLFSIGGVGE